MKENNFIEMLHVIQCSKKIKYNTETVLVNLKLYIKQHSSFNWTETLEYKTLLYKTL